MSCPGQNSIDLWVSMFRMMSLIRRSQELLIEEYHPADEMRCPIHFCLGQEATPTALSTLVRREDVVFSHHRSHGYFLAKGAPISDMVAEFYGKAAGANGGMAGSQELSHQAWNFYSGTILSGAIAIAAGSAFAAKYCGTDAIAVGVVGDGGMEEGIVFETMNLAAVKRLPVLFICENNGYSIHSPLRERSLCSRLTERAKAFGVDSRTLDGNDAIELQSTLSDVIADVRAGRGPAFVEVMTYRICGHVGPEGDDHYNYRSETEHMKWAERDPLTLLRRTLERHGIEAAELDIIDADARHQVIDAIAAAKAAPFPDFERAIGFNVSSNYSPIVGAMVDGTGGEFDPTQNETKLEPY